MLLEFQKTDTVRHLGQLDLQRTMQRALRRSGLPVRYSSGFNPHIVMSFASALSTGIPGDAELLDVSLSGDTTAGECLSRMNQVLPPTLPVKHVRLVDDRFPKLGGALAQAEYRIHLYDEVGRKLADAVPGFLAQTQIMAIRKSKRQETRVDIRPMIHELRVLAAQEGCVLTARVSFVEEATLKPELLMQALSEYAGVEMPKHDIRRTRLYGLKGGQVVPLIEL